MADQDKLVQVEISLARLERQLAKAIDLIEHNQEVIDKVIESLGLITSILSKAKVT